MPHDLEIFCDTIDMWPFQFRCWSAITHKNFALVTLCIALLRKMTSPRGSRFFFLLTSESCHKGDSSTTISSMVLFTLRVSLLESNHSATLANSELRF